MAKSRSEGPNKSEFIRGVLKTNAKATVKDVKAAWESAGYKDKLNPTLYYQVKRAMGLAKGKRRRGRPAKSATAAAPAAAAPSDKMSGYLRIEQRLDSLVLEAEGLGDKKLADEIRQARRRASAALT